MTMNDIIDNGLKKANGRRRFRKLTATDVRATIAAAKQQLGYAFMTGGSVANAYDYPCTAAAVAVISSFPNSRGRIAIKFGECNAKEGHSPVRWWGPESQRPKDVQGWIAGVDAEFLKGEGWVLFHE